MKNFYENEIEPYQAKQPDLVSPWEEKPEPIHTELLSADQVERLTGQDYSDLPNLNDVGPVIATVDDQGHILDKSYVQQQVEARVEDAREEEEIDEQREAFIEEEPEIQRVDTLSSAQERQSIATLNQLLDAVGADCFEGDRYVLERHGDLMTLTEKDGRGLILATQDEQVLKSELTDQDFGAFDRISEVLNRPTELDSGMTVEPPTLAVSELASAGLELD